MCVMKKTKCMVCVVYSNRIYVQPDCYSHVCLLVIVGDMYGISINRKKNVAASKKEKKYCYWILVYSLA